MIEHIKYVKNEIDSLKTSIPKKQKQLKELENMTLTEWLNEHLNK